MKNIKVYFWIWIWMWCPALATAGFTGYVPTFWASVLGASLALILALIFKKIKINKIYIDVEHSNSDAV